MAVAAPVEGEAEAEEAPEVRDVPLADALCEPTICVILAVEALAALPEAAELPLALALALALPVALACAPSFSTPLVIVTGNVRISSPSYVVVLLPGSFASVPVANSTQVAVAPIVQSSLPVKIPASPTPISMWYVEGP